MLRPDDGMRAYQESDRRKARRSDRPTDSSIAGYDESYVVTAEAIKSTVVNHKCVCVV